MRVLHIKYKQNMFSFHSIQAIPTERLNICLSATLLLFVFQPVKAIVQQKTVKEWFDECLMLPPLSGEGYKPEPIPDHYIEEERKFEHDAADSSFLDKQITVVPNPNMNNQQCSSWHYKRKSNGYKPKDNCGFVEIEIEPSSPRKRIVAVGGLYLGSVSAANIDLGEMLTAESVHSLVILGNLFDILSIDELHCIPTETQTIEEKLQSAIPVLDQIRKLVDDHRIQVYYLRGSHEQELTRAAIDRLLGDKITYIPQQSLVIANKADKDMYTMRFTTGQQWDLLNYVDLPNEELLASKPIGYYLHRAAAQTPNFSVSHLLHPMAERVPKDFNPTLLAHFSQQPFQEQITTMLMQMALQCKDVSIIRESRCVVSEGKYVTGSTIIDYPFLKYLINKVRALNNNIVHLY